MQVKKAKTKLLKDCVSDVMMDYIASCVEKMEILLVGVQKRMIINPKIEVLIPLVLVKYAIAKILKQEKHVSIVTKRNIS
jgi:hypothetical protein